MNIYDEAKNNIKDIEERLDELDNRVALESIDNLKLFIERAKKVEELLGLKNEMINAYQAHLASIHTFDRPMMEKWKNEIFRLIDVIYTKEKELGEMK